MSRGDIHVSNTFETSLIAVVRALAKSAAAAVLRRLLLLSDLHMTFVAWFQLGPLLEGKLARISSRKYFWHSGITIW